MSTLPTNWQLSMGIIPMPPIQGILPTFGRMNTSLTRSCAIWTLCFCACRSEGLQQRLGKRRYSLKGCMKAMWKGRIHRRPRELIAGAGLELVGEYADLTLAAPGPATQRITFHCRKPW